MAVHAGPTRHMGGGHPHAEGQYDLSQMIKHDHLRPLSITLSDYFFSGEKLPSAKKLISTCCNPRSSNNFISIIFSMLHPAFQLI